MPIRFRFRWVPFIAAAVAVAIGVSLGQWQMRRAAQKEAIETKLTAREIAPPVPLGSVVGPIDEIEYRRVLVTGEFVRDWPVYLENRPYRSEAGFQVLMPLKIAGSDMHIVVARGWVPRDRADRAKLPAIATPDGQVQLMGIARRNPDRLLQLGSAAELRPGAILQNLDVAEFAQASKLAMQPFVIEQLSDTHDGLVRDWPRPSAGIDRHLGYAFQWYALAATAFIFFVVTGFRRGTK
ncbi:MAG: SURF1-like protein [Herminiimonas sp.]|nr:SURF1-like protein [Herminiimonas sp.]